MAPAMLSNAIMIALLLLAGFVVLGILVGLYATATAPVGFQDEQGFHYGPKEEQQPVREQLPATARPKLA